MRFATLPDNQAYDWAVDLRQLQSLTGLIVKGDLAPGWRTSHRKAEARSRRCPSRAYEHYLPLLYAAGAADAW